MGTKLFRIDMENIMVVSMSITVIAPIKQPTEFTISLISSFKMVVNRTSLINFNFAEIDMVANANYSFDIPAGFWIDEFGEPSSAQTISFTTPNATVVSGFIPASSDPLKNTYGESHVYLNYDKTVTLQNKNYYLYSDYGNPSGVLIATYNAISSGKVIKSASNQVSIDISADVIPLRNYWIRAEQGVVKDSWNLQSPAITTNTYSFRAFKNSNVALTCAATIYSKPIKSPTYTGTNSNINYYAITSTFYKNIYADLSYNSSTQSGTVKIYDANTGNLLRSKNISRSIPTNSLTYTYIAVNSTHFAVSFVTEPSIYSDSTWVDNSYIEIYSIATGSLIQTITSSGHTGFGRVIKLTDSRLLIPAPWEHGIFTACVYLYDFNPSNGNCSFNSKINRPVAPWLQSTSTRKQSYFGAFEGGTMLNDNYIIIKSQGDSSSDTYPNIRIYNINGAFQRKITSPESGAGGSTFYMTNINDSNLFPMSLSSGNQIKVYDASTGNISNTISNYPSNGIGNEFVIVNGRLYELSTNAIFTNATYTIATTTNLLNISSNSFYKF